MPAETRISGYADLQKRRLLLVALNSAEQPQPLTFALDTRTVLDRAAKTVRNMETGESVPLNGTAVGPVPQSRHQVTFLIVE